VFHNTTSDLQDQDQDDSVQDRFFRSQTGLVLRPTVSDHVTALRRIRGNNSSLEKVVVTTRTTTTTTARKITRGVQTSAKTDDAAKLLLSALSPSQIR